MIGIMVLTLLIIVIGSFLSKKIGIFFESAAAIGVIVYLFYAFSFSEASLLYTVGAVSYYAISIMYSREKREQHSKIKDKLNEVRSQSIPQAKSMGRLVSDLLLTVCVSAGAIIFYVFAPETYALIKLLIIMGLILVCLQTVERIVIFFTTKIHYVEAEARLVIVSFFQARDFPLEDLKEVNYHSAPDLLRLHPLFTFLSKNQDFTLSFSEVLKLSFPGEYIYIAPKKIKKWERIFQSLTNHHAVEITVKQEEILPLWHPKNMRRLFWKGYFAATVKGISAYTGLLMVLIFLKVPSYVIVVFVLFWWLFNVYISDRVLVASTDAVEVKAGELYERAKAIFNRAGIKQTKLYVIDSPVHNGLATGMNIGRGTIMVTSATTELSDEAVDAFLAHEAIHVKKRDVLLNQVARMLFFGWLALLVYLFYDPIVLLADNLFLFIPVIYVMMILFPLYLSFVAQWAEVRADFLGAKLLQGGNEQMGNGLRELGHAIDEAQRKTRTYRRNDEKPVNDVPSDERPIWLLRVLEFQIMPHPPLYFRIENVLRINEWKRARWNWIKMRWRESIPFLKGRKSS